MTIKEQIKEALEAIKKALDLIGDCAEEEEKRGHDFYEDNKEGVTALEDAKESLKNWEGKADQPREAWLNDKKDFLYFTFAAFDFFAIKNIQFDGEWKIYNDVLDLTEHAIDIFM